eukprot:143830_1
MPADCYQCGKPNATSMCGGCKIVFYCNVKCQRANWKTHKKQCKMWRAKTNKSKVLNIGPKQSWSPPPVSYIQWSPSPVSYMNMMTHEVINVQIPGDLHISIVPTNDRHWDLNAKHGSKKEEYATDFKKSPSLKRIKLALKQYRRNILPVSKEFINVINDFIYLLGFEDDKDNFEYMCNFVCTENCAINQCDIFKRHYRQRTDEIRNIYKTNHDSHKIYMLQMMDKIHCYFYHTFDIGYRLHSSATQQQINPTSNIDEKYTDQSDKYLLNRSFERLCSQISNKTNNIQELDTLITDKLNTKYNQIQSVNGQKKLGMYSVGYLFKYGYLGEMYNTSYQLYDEVSQMYNIPQVTETMANNEIVIKKIYSSLKQELLKNNLCCITVENFNIEYKKASILFCSCYRKKHYSSQKKNMMFLKDHLLSLMIYCNFDILQATFSETYRKCRTNESKESIARRHSNFYWLGKYLKISVHIFGTIIRAGNVHSFYH